MIKLRNALFVLFIGFLFTSCSIKQDIVDTHTTQNSVSWEGYYFGKVDDFFSKLRIFTKEKKIFYTLYTKNKTFKGEAFWRDNGSYLHLKGIKRDIFVSEAYVKLKGTKNSYILNKYDEFTKKNKKLFVDNTNIKEIKDDNTHIITLPVIINLKEKPSFIGKINIDCGSKVFKIFEKNIIKKDSKSINSIKPFITKLISNYCLF